MSLEIIEKIEKMKIAEQTGEVCSAISIYI